MTITLYVWSSPIKDPGWPSSNRIRTLKAVPVKAAHAPSIKYIEPISLWFVENIHRIDRMTELGIRL